jgi:predicted dehydrogenase
LLLHVGEIQAVHASFFGFLPRVDDVRFVPELGGGALLDLGCYCVSACRLVLGEPGRVYGEAWLGRGGVDERFAGTLRFGDVVATFQCGFTATLNEIEVVGRDGVLSVPQAFVNPPGVVLVNGEEHRVEPGNHYRAELDDFCAAIRGERQALNGRAEMLGQARVLAALLRSADAGSPVAL